MKADFYLWISKIIILLVFLCFSCASQSERDPDIYEVNGKIVRVSELPPTARQQWHDANLRAYNDHKRIVEDQLILEFLRSKAENSGKSIAQLEAEYLLRPDPTDQDLKLYAARVKDQIPYPIEMVQGELKKLLVREMQHKERNALIEAITKEKTVRLFFVAPESPKVTVKTTGYAAKGPADAKIEIVQYADFTCPVCREARASISAIEKKYPGKIRVVYKYFPIASHEGSHELARLAHCAHQQGVFWTFHDLAFDKQGYLDVEEVGNIAKAIKVGSVEEFESCFHSRASAVMVDESINEATKYGVKSTPTFFVNGMRLGQALDEKKIEDLLQKEDAKR